MAQKNDPRRAGQVAGKMEFFGQFARYAVYPVHTRFEALQWFIADAEANDLGVPEIIGQHPTHELAVAAAERLAAREKVAC